VTNETKVVLPSWAECNAAVAAGEATALQRFIRDHEPAGALREESFRSGLLAVLLEVSTHPEVQQAEKRACRNCRHWAIADDGARGGCAVLMAEPKAFTWVTSASHACDKWKARG
jgi:hypothetical protein